MSDNLIQCAGCNTLNRIPSIVSSNVACGNCGRALIAIPRTSSGIGGRLLLLGIILGAFGTMYLLPRGRTTLETSSRTTTPTVAQSSPTKPAVEAKMTTESELLDFAGEDVLTDEEVFGLTRPSTGHFGKAAKKSVAPLKISVSPNADYFVYLVDGDGLAVASFYIRAGQTLESKMPLGTFELFYVAGTTWYGEDRFFGDNTVYSVVTKQLSFTRDVDGYNGIKVELILQTNGNLPTKGISRKEFLKRTRSHF